MLISHILNASIFTSIISRYADHPHIRRVAVSLCFEEILTWSESKIFLLLSTIYFLGPNSRVTLSSNYHVITMVASKVREQLR